MPKIYVHDFKFEYDDIANTAESSDFFVSLTVWFNFSDEDPGDGWDKLEWLNISVANPMGLAKYLQHMIKKGLFKEKFFFPHLLIVEANDPNAIEKFVKMELESLTGKSEKELKLKALRYFDWEWDNYPDSFSRLLSK
jgi:hypothetical protein